MKLAWFRAEDTRAPHPLDPTAALITLLSRDHQIDVITELAAHDFVWKHFRRPYDVCVFELEDTAAHAFIWPYAMEFGGIAMLHSLTFDAQQARLRYPIAPGLGARMIAVPYPGCVDALQDEFPKVAVRHAPVALAAIDRSGRPAAPIVTFGALATDALDLVSAGVEAARGHDVNARMLTASSPYQVIADADVVVSLRGGTAPESARLGMVAIASGRPVIALESVITADWPALDPHSWRPRPPAVAQPVAVTVDPRDEAHSVAGAIVRLARDRAMRARLSEAGRAWGHDQIGLPAAAQAWRTLLTEAAHLPAATGMPGRPAGLPDGTGDTRRILDEFGVTTDLL